MNARDLPHDVPVVVSLANEKRLPSTIRAAAATGSTVLLLTDDVEALPPLPPGVVACEPELFLDGGVAVLDQWWDADVDRWLRALFPGEIENEALGPLLLVNVFRQFDFVHRNYAIAVARGLLETVQPRSVWPVGQPPFHCHLVVDAARRAGVPIEERGPWRWRRRLARAQRLPAGLTIGAAYFLFNAAKALAQLPGRRRVERRLAALGIGKEASPPLWTALTPGYIQPSRHIWHAVLSPANARGDAYGLLYCGTYGVSRADGGLASDELSLLDGSVDRLRPAAVDQVAGAVGLVATLRTLARWTPLALRAIASVIASVDGLVVAGTAGSRLEDLRMLLRVATGDLLRVVDAASAARRWIERHPTARVVMFNNPTLAESKIVDVLMQRAGITTIDYPHGYISEGNMRTSWPSRSSLHLAWTREQAQQLAPLGLHRDHRGGYVPWKRVEPVAATRPRILVVSGYWWHGPYIQQLKYARRLAHAVAALHSALGDRAELTVRLHPLDDRDTWRRHFAPGDSPPLSSHKQLGDDLARADIVVCTLSSSYVEALTYGVPVLLHRGPAVERDSLFARAPKERWFDSGSELVAKLEALLPLPRDIEPERQLAAACFGPGGQPESALQLVDELLQRGDG